MGRKHHQHKSSRVWPSAGETCPKCGGGVIRFSETFLRHALRRVLGSRRRFCLACGHKWSAHMSKGFLKLKKRDRYALIIGVLVILILTWWSMAGNKTASEMAAEYGSYVTTEGDEDVAIQG